MIYLDSLANLKWKVNADFLPHFYGKMEVDEFKENKKYQKDNWPWHDKDAIRYTVNSEHYRCPEFGTIDWSNSIALMGCSEIFGLSIDDSHCVSVQLQKLLNVNVVNLGVPGGNANVLLYNSQVLKKNDWIPKAVIVLFPPPCRDAYYYKDRAAGLGPWSETKNNDDKMHYRSFAYEDTNWKVKSYLSELAVQDAWQYITTFIGFHVIMPDAEDREWQLSKPWRRMPIAIDFGRDLRHSGPETNKQRAEIISSVYAEKMRKKKIRG